ncbi:MAG TPA: hypothetical protein VF815_38585 [Myxococcaceae bacterium]|jgi:hypothetical protein
MMPCESRRLPLLLCLIATCAWATDQTAPVQCGAPWEAPEVTALDACGQPMPVYQYNTGDDDEDGIPGTIDPDDFGPGPDLSQKGTYYVQYLTWDEEFYNIMGAILTLHVVNCPQ